MTIGDIFDSLPTIETARLLLWEISPEERSAFIHRLPPCDRATCDQEEPGHGAATTITIGQLGVHHLPAWGLVQKERDELIGYCAFETWHLEHARAAICCALCPDHRGRGYMTETLKAVLGFGFRVMELNRIEALCAPDNRQAVRMIRNIGLQEEAILRHYRCSNGVPSDRSLFSILRKEWSHR